MARPNRVSGKEHDGGRGLARFMVMEADRSCETLGF